MGYEAPTLVLIKHKEKSPENQPPTASTQMVFGVYHTAPWKDNFGYQGDGTDFLFSLFPKFKQFFTYQGKGATNFAYFNTKFVEKSQYPVGMGFGGSNDYKQFRIWIDDAIEEKSYVSPEDDTFAIGFLLNQNSKLCITAIEIWGLGTEEHLQKQINYRVEQQKELERMRKVDKKALFDNQFNQEMFFGKLMGHRQQLREEVCFDQGQCQEDQGKIKNQQPIRQ